MASLVKILTWETLLFVLLLKEFFKTELLLNDDVHVPCICSRPSGNLTLQYATVPLLVFVC
jgi:hypothetical protein